MHGFTQDSEILVPSSSEEWQRYHEISEKEIFTHIPYITYNLDHHCFKSKAHHHFIIKLRQEYTGIIQLEYLDHDEWALRLIAVEARYQNNKIGTRMIAFVKQFCKMHNAKNIRTHANIRAIEFYKKSGFIEQFWHDISINEDTKDMVYNIGGG